MENFSTFVDKTCSDAVQELVEVSAVVVILSVVSVMHLALAVAKIVVNPPLN